MRKLALAAAVLTLSGAYVSSATAQGQGLVDNRSSGKGATAEGVPSNQPDALMGDAIEQLQELTQTQISIIETLRRELDRLAGQTQADNAGDSSDQEAQDPVLAAPSAKELSYSQDPVELAAAEEAFDAAQTLRVSVAGELLGIPYFDVGGKAIFEGDIVLGSSEQVALLNLFAGVDMERLAEAPASTPETVRSLALRGLAIVRIWAGRPTRWPDAVVPYTIDPGLADPRRVTAAIEHWQANTALRFVQRTAENQARYPAYLVFRPGDGCSSMVGQQGGRQNVTLSAACTVGNTIHEIGHAIGLGHEQTREDRDQFVFVDMSNIKPKTLLNFQVNRAKYDDMGEYDFGSVMHYPAHAFAIDPSRPTITPRLPGMTIGQRRGLSAGDLAAVKAIYNP